MSRLFNLKQDRNSTRRIIAVLAISTATFLVFALGESGSAKACAVHTAVSSPSAYGVSHLQGPLTTTLCKSDSARAGGADTAVSSSSVYGVSHLKGPLK